MVWQGIHTSHNSEQLGKPPPVAVDVQACGRPHPNRRTGSHACTRWHSPPCLGTHIRKHDRGTQGVALDVVLRPLSGHTLQATEGEGEGANATPQKPNEMFRNWTPRTTWVSRQMSSLLSSPRLHQRSMSNFHTNDHAAIIHPSQHYAAISRCLACGR